MKKYVFFSGGIGNQMFQYAFMLSLMSKKHKVVPIAYLYDFDIMHNGYMLEKAFGISNKKSHLFLEVKVFLSRIIAGNRLPFLLLIENEDKFCEDFYLSQRPFFKGCWINERYFEEIKDEVRTSFIFKNIDSRNLSIANQIQSCNSVSLHIRRGDYLNNPMYNVCDEDYYRKAVYYISEKVDNPKFIIFSDDPVWCKEFMCKLDVDYTIIDHNTGKDSYKDMYLMTQCKHNVIANSTFSWWGAWLGAQKDKVVVCPNRWINGREFNPCLEEWYHIL